MRNNWLALRRKVPWLSVVRTACQDLLDVRAFYGLARAMAPLDPLNARDIACEALRHAVTLGYAAQPSDPIPALIANEPVVQMAYRIGCFLSQGASASTARHEQRKLDKQQRRADADAAMGSVEELLARLRSGEWLDENGHTLALDDDFGEDALVGTNAYGVDYYGSLTVSYVKWWRSMMVEGKDIGDVPPCAHEPSDDDIAGELGEIQYLADGLAIVDVSLDLRTVVLHELLQRWWPDDEPGPYHEPGPYLDNAHVGVFTNHLHRIQVARISSTEP